MDNLEFCLPSVEIDRFLGYQIDHIEKTLYEEARSLRPEGGMSNFGQVLHHGSQTWIGLDPQTLLTPYNELNDIASLLRPAEDEHLVDLGAGYGRMGIVLHLTFPGVKFTGFELVEERVREGNRIFQEHQCRNSLLKVQDLAAEDFILPDAEYYFIYDYGKTSHIRKTLKQLEEKTSSSNFKVVARGKGSRSIIEHEHPWLSQINPVHHEKNFSIYAF